MVGKGKEKGRKVAKAGAKPKKGEDAAVPDEEGPIGEEPSSDKVSVCIVCREEKEVSPVKDDAVISTIRAVKTRLGFASNKELVVCGDCLEEHKKRRQGFEKNLVQYGAFGLIVLVVLFILTQTLNALFVGVMLLALMLVMSLFYYHPALEAEG
ncbi:MAG: hypothetical protein NT157_06375 [Candidatus Micrarchaeota archaeon]|nr:hypothetical protein [Candidatus Micrarchaeota archaeon]